MKNHVLSIDGLLPDAAVRPAPAPLRKKYLKSLFHDLRHQAHHLHALLSHLPGEQFSVVRFFDYRNAKEGWEDRAVPDYYTLREFYAYAGQFHLLDEFRILFGERALHFEPEATAETFAEYYDEFLQSRCEKRLRANDPLRLTRELIRQYGLTRQDVRIVRDRIEAYNAAAVAKIQAEYDALKALACVTK